MHVEEVKVYVADVEVTPSRSEAGVGLVGTIPSRATSADAFAACGELGTVTRDASASASPSNQEFTCNGAGVG
eukprot:1281495-Pleurochrysis_carterae.AAC.1